MSPFVSRQEPLAEFPLLALTSSWVSILGPDFQINSPSLVLDKSTMQSEKGTEFIAKSRFPVTVIGSEGGTGASRTYSAHFVVEQKLSGLAQNRPNQPSVCVVKDPGLKYIGPVSVEHNELLSAN